MKRRQPPTTVIKNCNFTTGPASPHADVMKAANLLAEAAADNARAIERLARLLSGPDNITSISIGDVA